MRSATHFALVPHTAAAPAVTARDGERSERRRALLTPFMLTGNDTAFMGRKRIYSMEIGLPRKTDTLEAFSREKVLSKSLKY